MPLLFIGLLIIPEDPLLVECNPALRGKIGRFIALGRRIDLSTICHPLFLLAARDDELVSTDQLFATARHVGTPKRQIETATAPCGHLALFLGAETLKHSWARIARWLGEDLADRVQTGEVR